MKTFITTILILVCIILIIFILVSKGKNVISDYKIKNLSNAILDKFEVKKITKYIFTLCIVFFLLCIGYSHLNMKIKDESNIKKTDNFFSSSNIKK